MQRSAPLSEASLEFCETRICPLHDMLRERAVLGSARQNTSEQVINEMPRVSVIVPAYNAARFLPFSIESVIRQTYGQWELIVVDDGSTDETRELVGSYSQSLGEKLKYVYQSNRGLPAARNTGIRNATGDLIALLDADDIWLPNRLDRSVAVMDGNPEVGLVHGRFEKVDVQGIPIPHLRPTFPLKILSGNISDHIYTRGVNLGCPTITFRKACVDQVGWFDETMRATEDRDLWFRIARSYRVAFIDEVIAHYRVTPGSMSSDTTRMFTWQKFFVDKYYKARVCGPVSRWRAMASIYREQGDNLFRRSKTAESTAAYFTAVLYNPFEIANVYMFTKAAALALVRRFGTDK
jgi:glycosyltransferase involved in cell wall biosynthesis